MDYNINAREETFGGTLFDLETGKREYVNKEELKNILERKRFPEDSVVKNVDKEYKIKFTPLNIQKSKIERFSFADIAFIELTRACNIRCKHCLNASGNVMPNQLSMEELINLIKDLADSGIQEIRFTGGEPLLFEGIYELIDLATKYGIYTSLGTNATMITENVAKKLKEAGLKKAIVSIDGTKDMNDFIRGIGNYERAMAGINCLTQQNIKVRVNSVIMKSNMEDIIKLAKEMHKNKTLLFIRRFIESGRGVSLKNNTLSQSDYQYVKEQLNFELQNGPYVNGHYLRNDEDVNYRITLPFEIIKGCKAGQRATVIMPDGEIHLCGFLAAQGFPSIDNVRNIKDWKLFWNEIQEYDRLGSLRDNLDKYNNRSNVQTTNCLAYVQRFLDKEG